MDRYWRPEPPDGVDPVVWSELPPSVCQELVGPNGAEGRCFVDGEFPAGAKALNGLDEETCVKDVEEIVAEEKEADQRERRCKCGKTARLLTVRKENRNKGRHFLGCASRSCSFFEWAPDGTESPARKRSRHFGRGIGWRRFKSSEGWVVVKSSLGFHPDDVRQGALGDCWFLSVLAVLAERPDLVNKVVLTKQANVEGKYSFRFFLDGTWKELCVDDQLPVKGTRAAFAQPVRNQLWASLLEKAYAKAHGSYAAIIGGEVAEAMLELTGCPSETMTMGSADFDSDVMWERLVSFSASGFPMGCATAFGGRGLVPMHAYSILDVKEIGGVVPGQQLKLDAFFRNPATQKKVPEINLKRHLDLEPERCLNNRTRPEA